MPVLWRERGRLNVYQLPTLSCEWNRIRTIFSFSSLLFVGCRPKFWFGTCVSLLRPYSPLNRDKEERKRSWTASAIQLEAAKLEPIKWPQRLSSRLCFARPISFDLTAPVRTLARAARVVQVKTREGNDLVRPTRAKTNRPPSSREALWTVFGPGGVICSGPRGQSNSTQLGFAIDLLFTSANYLGLTRLRLTAFGLPFLLLFARHSHYRYALFNSPSQAKIYPLFIQSLTRLHLAGCIECFIKRTVYLCRDFFKNRF